MFSNILLPVDLTNRDTQLKAVDVAADLARKYAATLNLMTVVPDFGMSIVASYFPKDFEKEALAKAERELRAFGHERRMGDGIQVSHIVGHGSIYREILRAADDARCDLIVMASHRPELQDYLLGPNAARVVRHAKQSVLVVRE